MANKKTVLVIDDDPDIIDSVKVILGSSGFAVTTAMSGQEGIDAAVFRQAGPDTL